MDAEAPATTTAAATGSLEDLAQLSKETAELVRLHDDIDRGSKTVEQLGQLQHDLELEKVVLLEEQTWVLERLQQVQADLRTVSQVGEQVARARTQEQQRVAQLVEGHYETAHARVSAMRQALGLKRLATLSEERAEQEASVQRYLQARLKRARHSGGSSRGSRGDAGRDAEEEEGDGAIDSARTRRTRRARQR